MNYSELKKLKSGTDVRGVAVGNVTLTDEAVTLITKAFVKWLSDKYGEKSFKIAVGHDSRISAGHLSDLVKSAIISTGSSAVFTGLSSTPSMFILLKKSDWGCDASIMITASHLPYERNGLKFFTPDGGLDGKDIDEILKLAAEGNFPKGAGKTENKSYMDEYSAILVKEVEAACGYLPLKGKKIIVDAGNGAGGFFTKKVLIPLGADVTGSQFLEPDGLFPNHIPNPEDEGAILSLCSAVIKNKADLGIIFDTDVDRAACVDGQGNKINRNSLIALLSAILLKDKPGVIVTDSVTSNSLTEFIQNLGGKHLRFKRGYKNVIDKCIELNESGIYSPLAIETSGHAAFKENYYLDDGAYLIVKILICLSQQKNGESLTSLISGLDIPLEKEIRLSFTDKSKDFKAEGLTVIEDLKKHAENDKSMSLAPDNYEGVKVNMDCGSFILRMSVHDPVVPINFESATDKGLKDTAERLLKLLNYEFLNVEKLIKYITE